MMEGSKVIFGWAEAAKTGKIGAAITKQKNKCAVRECSMHPDPRFGFFCPDCQEAIMVCGGHWEPGQEVEHTCPAEA